MPTDQTSPAIRAGAVVALGLALTAADAQAEWQFNGSVSNTLEAVTDREREGVNDLAFGATSAFRFTLAAIDPRTQWTTNLGLTLAGFIGPGSEDDFDQVDPSFSTAFSHRLRNWTFGLNGTFDVQPTSVTQLEDTGLTDEDALQISGSLGGSVGYAVTPRDSLSFSPSVSFIRFDDDNADFTPSDSYRAGVNWSHAVNSKLQLSFGGSAARVYADDETETVSTSASLNAGFGYSANRSLTYNINLGPSFSFTDRSNGGEDNFGVGVSGSGGLNWLPTSALGLGVTFSNSLDTGSDGVLENVSRFGANISYAFNRTLSGGFGLSYLRRGDEGQVLPIDARLETYSASPSLSIVLYRDVRASAGYSLTLSSEDGEKATSNRFFVTVSAGF